MRNKQEETKQLVNRNQMEALHQKHMALARVAEREGDQVLTESHYQRAEYYFHAINEQGSPVPIDTVATTTRSPTKASYSTKKIIKDFNLKRTNHKDPPNAWEKPAQEGRVLSFRRHYLHRNRRNIQDKEIPE